MKSTGLHEAYKMAILARALDMKLMVGCMTETSCAVTAAAQLAPLMDWADLDGNLLIANDRFDGIKIVDRQGDNSGSTGNRCHSAVIVNSYIIKDFGVTERFL